MRIAAIGAGHIGGTLGKKWAAAGHEVVFGVRAPESPKTQDLLRTLAGNASADTIPGAIAKGEVVLFAIPGAVMGDAARSYGKALDGKTVIDATNRIPGSIFNSLAELSAHAPRARLVRAFGNIVWEVLAEPVIGGIQADLIYCAAEGARDTAERLISEVGLRPICLGGLDQVGLVDAILPLAFQLMTDGRMGRPLAFKVLTPKLSVRPAG
jgi:predicted dinucleotide-binding enzyme